MTEKQALIVGVFSGIGASLCCVVPLLLLSLGLGGAWVAYLTSLAPVRPVLIVFSLFFIGLAFRKLYLIPRVCEPGMSCANDETQTRQRFIFWAVTIPLFALLAFPWFAPWFY